jgi:N-hydroxyarylamine O-acetyltransferase
MRLADYLSRIGLGGIGPDASLSQVHLAHRETDLYEFSDDPQTAWDVEVANHFTSTHPESVFRRALTIQRSRRDERVILRTGVLTRYRNGWMTDEPIDRAQLTRVARELFGVELPDGPLVFDTLAATVASS